MEVIASRSDSWPFSLLGASSSSVRVVTVRTAGARRSSSCSSRKGSRRGRGACRCGEAERSRGNQRFMALSGEGLRMFACTLQAQFGSLVILGKRESKRNSGELSTLSRLKGVFSDRTGLQVSEGRGGQE